MKLKEFWVSEISNTGWTNTEFHKLTKNQDIANKFGNFIHVREVSPELNKAYKKMEIALKESLCDGCECGGDLGNEGYQGATCFGHEALAALKKARGEK